MSLENLRALAQRGSIRWLSCYFAEFIAGQCDGADELLLASAALVSEAHLDGDVCVELGWYAGAPLFDVAPETAATPRGIAADEWAARLLAAPCVGRPGEQMPLIVDHGRLYLYRYWRYESRVAERLLALLAAADEAPADKDTAPRIAGLDRDQSAAVVRAARQRFNVISGGPGSGKTSTVVRLLDALLEREPRLRVALTAPTGKAAARLKESIRARLAADGASAAAALGGRATTLHRLLGARGDRFLYGRDRRLAVDCVIVDEASMVDLKLMHQLLEALPDGARLVLLGDRDQLASVAAGNVLGDITGHGHRLDGDAPPIGAAISLLGGAYRFGDASAIGRLAGLINAGDVDGAIGCLRAAPGELEWFEDPADAPSGVLLERIIEAYQPIFTASDPLEALAVYDSVRVLCATNGGPQGVDRLNSEISAALATRNGLGEGPIEHGQPILIGRNHHQLELYNGDTGILWRIDGELHACFQSESGELRRFGVHRLSGYEPAWAVTVHKSQGSEYDGVVLLLGNDPAAEGLSRELLYTAVTRARSRFALHGSEQLLGGAIRRITRRHSGLAGRLGWPA